MHKKLKAKVLSLVLSAMVITMMPLNVFAAEGASENVRENEIVVSTLDELNTALSNGGAVTLGADFDLDVGEELTIYQKDVTLDLNGHTITYAGTGNQVMLKLRQSSSLTVIGNGTLSCEKGRVIVVDTNSKITVLGGTITTATGYAVSAQAVGASIIVDGGTVSATSSGMSVQIGVGSAEIKSGTVSTDSGFAIEMGGHGGVTISGGTISAGSGSAIHKGSWGDGVITINGNPTITSANPTQGTITVEAMDTDSEKKCLVVTGGTISNTADPEGYSVYFSKVTLEHLDNVYSNADATVGRVYPALDEAVAFSGVTANGTSNTDTTSELTLTFDKDIAGLEAGDITLTGATKGTLTKQALPLAQLKKG